MGEQLQFPIFVETETTKCALPLSTGTDRALTMFYSMVEKIISIISRPFPHQELLDRHALVGQPRALRDSLIVKYAQWIDFEQWLLLSIVLALSTALIFTVGYLLYLCCCRCCSCRCCTKGGKKLKRDSPRQILTDREHDACKRNVLNVLLGVCVLINIFAVVALIMSAQYAEYGADQLPSRLNLCIDDVNVYKRDTDRRIRKLLIDDFHYLNRSLQSTLDEAGRSVVSRLKKSTGASAMDHFFNISHDADQILTYLTETKVITLANLNKNLTKLRNDFARLRKTAGEQLKDCDDENLNNKNVAVQGICRRVQRMFETMDHLPMAIQMDPSTMEITEQLTQIIKYNISEIFAGSNRKFDDIALFLQEEIDQRRHLMESKLKILSDDLFLIAETMSNQIRQVNLDQAYNAVSRFADANDSYREYVKYSWWGSLVLGGVFCLIGLCFGLGLIYGCFGSRSSPYHDECCVRGTGSRLYSCGICMALLFLLPLCAMSAVLMLVGSNLSNVICQPMIDPLQRPDSITLLERYIERWRNDRVPDELTKLIEEPRTGELIRGCYRNQTLYEMLDLDKKYHLSEMKIYQQEELDQLHRNLDLVFADIRVVQKIGQLINAEDVAFLDQLKSVNVTQIPSTYLNMLDEQSKLLNLKGKVQEVLGETRSRLNDQKLRSVAEQVEQLDGQLGEPIREQLALLRSRLGQLNKRLAELTVPVPSLLLRLQHAQALLAEDLAGHLEQAVLELLKTLKGQVDAYITHMSTEVSSCAPLMRIGRAVRHFVCDDTVYPLNGLWMAMWFSLFLTIPIILLSNCLKPLYEKIHPYPKYIVQEPLTESHSSAFATDSYEHCTLRSNKHQQPIYTNSNSYGSGAYEEFPPPYFGLRTRT